MVAGTLSAAGYYMGDRMMPPTESNPKGYFEAFDIEEINEDILSLTTPSKPGGLSRKLFPCRPRRSQFWLSRVQVGTSISCPDSLVRKIEEKTSHAPFCFKDPRFCYTLPAWRPFLRDAVFICVFRDPAITVSSIMKEVKSVEYLKDFWITAGGAMKVWSLMYRHILEVHCSAGEWLFLHYDQVISGEAMARIRDFTGANIDTSFPERSLRRSAAAGNVPVDVRDLYNELCRRAGYNSL